jgi:hypothetical protein
LGGGQARASITYQNPFHPQQCDLAIAAARQAFNTDQNDRRSREVLAQGLLCRGLRDDPWALDAAIRELERLLAEDDRDFFSRLYLAEAMRRRFPLSEEAVKAFVLASGTLPAADVGAARADLAAHIEGSLRALQAHGDQFRPRLERLLAQEAMGALTREQLPEIAVLLAQTGPGGVDRALAILDAHRAEHQDPAFATFYRAELLRGRITRKEATRLYRSAETVLCDDRAPAREDECSRARWRLRQLAGTEGRDT